MLRVPGEDRSSETKGDRNMSQKYHKVGFIAFGQRGQQLAETLINELPEYGCPAAVCDLRKNPVVSPLFSFRCPDVPFVTDYHELLAMPEIDSVIISTYEDKHVEIAKAAIEAGKAVYCEKPVVQSLADAEELYKFVTSRPCQFQIGLNLPNFPVPLKLKELLDRKIIGDLIMVRAACDVGQRFARNFLINKFSGKRGNFITAKLTHDTDLLQYLCGSYAETVWGKTLNRIWRRHGEASTSDDTALMAGELNSGVLFSMALTSCGSSYERKIHFFGTKGELLADLHAESVTFKPAVGEPVSIPAPNLNGGGHNGADFVTLRGFLDYLDSEEMAPRWPERILSSVMIPMAAIENKLVHTGEWYRSIVGR